MKVIILGNGFVASHLPYEIAKYRLTPNEEDMGWFINQYSPDVVINATGFCGSPNVDQCEIEKSKTYMANVVIPLMLAEECEQRGIHLIHIGSGCIYFGRSRNGYYAMPSGLPHYSVDTGWEENDFANPKSYYSQSKYACDLMLGSMKHVTNLRIRMPISTKNNPRNLINKLRGYRQIIDIPNSVTFMDDLTRCIEWAINGSHTGIYHVTNPEPLTAVQVMKEFQKYVPSYSFEIIDEAQLDKITIAKRSNCILNTDKLNKAGFHMTPSMEALKNCMANYITNI